MLEILGIALLCQANKKNAIQRGRKPGGFVALTIILWLALEIIGLFLGVALGLGNLAYVMGLLFGGIGALISYLAAKSCKQGDFKDPALINTVVLNTTGTRLEVPATLNIIRESSVVGVAIVNEFVLNGQKIGNLSSGQSMTAQTGFMENVLVANDSFGFKVGSYVFNVQSGATANIYFKSGKFLFKKMTGTLPYTQPSGTPTPDVLPEGGSFCPMCGEIATAEDRFCRRCGAAVNASPVPAQTSDLA